MPLKASFKKLRYALLLGRIAGPSVLAGELVRQIYSRSYFVGLEKDLSKPCLDFPTNIQYTLQTGNQADMDETLAIAKTASKDSAYELVMRIMFYDSGFRKFYAARTREAGELCYIGWVLSSAEHPELRDGIKGIPPVKDNEVLLFNLLAFEKYRGKGLATSVDTQLCKIAMQNGYGRAVAYPLANNAAGIKALEKIGFRKSRWKFERRFLFSVKREFGSDMNTFPNPERLPL
jgi:RimJ/RimL family protein N-acetyltransferase